MTSFPAKLLVVEIFGFFADFRIAIYCYIFSINHKRESDSSIWSAWWDISCFPPPHSDGWRLVSVYMYVYIYVCLSIYPWWEISCFPLPHSTRWRLGSICMCVYMYVCQSIYPWWEISCFPPRIMMYECLDRFVCMSICTYVSLYICGERYLVPTPG